MTLEATHDICIAATRDQVWDLLADVGWWLGQGDHADQEWLRGDLEHDDLYPDILIDPVLGPSRSGPRSTSPPTSPGGS